MKTRNIFNILALAVSAAVLALSCAEKETEPKADPAFPSLIENYAVKPGEMLEITFTPNYDWKISIPSEIRNYFWIDDNGIPLASKSGYSSTSPVTVKIKVTDKAEFDQNFSCEVTLTMDDKTQTVAKYMLPAKERILSVFAAEKNEDGSWKLAEDGESYSYSSSEATSLELSWSVSDAAFIVPVKIDANHSWGLKSPDWIDVSIPENTTGVVELLLTGSSLDEVSGKLSFVDENGKETKSLNIKAPSAREVAMYTAVVTEGELEYGEEGDYAWNEHPAESVELIWLGSDFRMPVKIDSKCNWALECPEWLVYEIAGDSSDEENSGKTAGVVTVILKGVPSKYPLESTTESVSMTVGDEEIFKFDVTIPGCLGVFNWSVNMGLTELDFNYSGALKTSIGYEDISASVTMTGTSSASVLAVEYVAGKYQFDAAPQWLDLEVSAYNTASGADVLQERTVTISVSENLSDERSAMLFFLPENYSERKSDLFNDDRTGVKDEYKKYAITVRQYSQDVEYITMNSTQEEMSSVGASFAPADEAKAASLSAQFGKTSYIYTLAYEYVYSRDNAWMTLARPYTKVKYYDQDYVDHTADDAGFWLSYISGNEDSTYGQLGMYVGAEELPAESSVGYAVFYDSNENVLAIVECTSPKAQEVVTPPSGGDTPEEDVLEDISRKYIIGATAAIDKGAKLEKITAGPTYNSEIENIANGGAEVWVLTLPSYESPVEIRLNGKNSKYYNIPWALKEYISVNDQKYESTQGRLTSAITIAKISMVQIPSDASDKPCVRFYVSESTTNGLTNYPFLVVYLKVKE